MRRSGSVESAHRVGDRYLIGPSSLCPPYRAFWGTDKTGIPLLRSLASQVLRIAFDGLCVCVVKWTSLPNPPDDFRDDGIMPVPWHLVAQRDDVEFDWADWIIFLGMEYKHPAIIAFSGPIDIFNDDELGEFLILPNGKPVGRFTESDEKKDEIVEMPYFKKLLKEVQRKGIREVSVLEGSIFLAFTTAIDLLIKRIESQYSPRPKP